MGNLETKERYVNFYTDFAFKKFFGTEANKDILISFLNSLFDGQEVVEDLEYLNPEQLGPTAVERKAVFDVYCRNSKGDRFLIEMQKAEQNFFKDRSIYYSTFPIQEQAVKGGWNFRLEKVYTIGILNFQFDDTDPEYYHHEVKLMDTKNRNVFYDKLTYIYIEMPKFHKDLPELETLFDKWLYAMKHLSSLDEKPQQLQEAIFSRLFELAEIAKFSQVEQRSYRESQKDFWDLFSVKETAENKGYAKGMAQGIEKGMAQGIEKGMAQGIEKGMAQGIEKGMAQGIEKGMAQGREEGMAQGRAEGVIEVARNMKKLGIPIETIMQSTGLSSEEITAL